MSARVVPRLVASDLDGTLLRSDGTLSPRTRAALSAVVAAGVELVVVTARPPRYVRPLVEQLSLRGVAICANGAIRYDLAAGAWHATHPVPTAVARRAVAALAGPGVGFAVETGEMVVYEPGFARPDQGDVRVPAVDLAHMWRLAAPIVKVLAFSAARTGDELLAAARSGLRGEVECTHSGGAGLLEISAPGVTKAAALARLCTQRGIAPAEVVAFGDMPNDLEMLCWAGAGYAVANAHPTVLGAVPGRAPAADDDGVAQVLESLLS